MNYPEIAQRVFNTPLMMHSAKAHDALSWLAPRVFGNAPVEIVSAEQPIRHIAFERGRPSAARLGDPMQAWQSCSDQNVLDVFSGVALIGVEGTLVHKGKWIGKSSGLTSYEGLHRQINAARRRPDVRGVVYEIDSFGGEVSGAFDVAENMHQLSLEKPTMAILTDYAYSAGYLLGCAAREMIIPETGGAGSIGVISLHADFSKHLEKEGIKVTILAAGKHKGDGNPYEELPDDVAERWRAELEAGRQAFAAAVAKYRGSRLSLASALATEAECYRGPEAVKLGLCDAVARPSEAFEAFVAEVAGR